MSRDNLFKVLKIGFAVALIYWLVQRGHLDVKELGALVVRPELIALGLGLAAVNLFIANWRWVVLLQAQGFTNTVFGTMPLSLIGLFFNFAIPGSVSGDLVKGYYIAKDNPERRLRAATTVVVDRIVGFFGMMLFALTAILYNLEFVLSNKSLVSVFFLVGSGIVSLSVFFVASTSQALKEHPLVEKFLDKVPGGKIFSKIYDAFYSYRSSKLALLKALILSLGAQATAITFFVVMGEVALGHGLGISAYLFAVPVGFIVTAIPLSPGGVGVGQVAFMYLFKEFASPTAPVGPVEISFFQLCLLAWAAIGLGFYIQRSRAGKMPLADTAESEATS